MNTAVSGLEPSGLNHALPILEGGLNRCRMVDFIEGNTKIKMARVCD